MKQPDSSSIRLWTGILLIALFLLAGFTGLSGRLFDLQFQDRQVYDQASRVQRFAVVQEAGRRGLITDCRGKI